MTTGPDGLPSEFADCLRDAPHVKTLAGLMARLGVRTAIFDGESHHGVPWACVFFVGKDLVGLLREPMANLPEIAEKALAEAIARAKRN